MPFSCINNYANQLESRVMPTSPDQARRRKDRNLLFVNQYRTSCLFCKSEDNLQFHHINPLEKKFDVTQNLRLSQETILEEIKKCWCLCKECHIKLHNRLVDPLPSTYNISG